MEKYYCNGKVCIAGIETAQEWVDYMSAPHNTGYTFIRKHDNFNVGQILHLGVDHSFKFKRNDKVEYYKVVEV